MSGSSQIYGMLQDQLEAKIEELEQENARLRKVLQEISYADMRPIPCPDGKVGCLVAHYGLGDLGKMARKALEKSEWISIQGSH